MEEVAGQISCSTATVFALFVSRIFKGHMITAYSMGPGRGRPPRVILQLLGFVSLTTGFFWLGGCAGLPVRGHIAGQAIDARVDSEIARYYVENYLPGKRTEPIWDARIDRLYQNAHGRLPNRGDLKTLSDEFSLDFAALYFADQIMRVPVNGRFQRAYKRALEYTRETFPSGNLKLPASARAYEVLVVPTYLYKRFLGTGADLATPRAALQKIGLPCHFVETSDDGPVEANANIVMAAIKARAHSGRRLIIISASKSGAEVALALTRLGPTQTRHVAAWINAVGALQGTPLIDDHAIPEMEFFIGKLDPVGVESLTTWRSRQRFKSFRIPKPISVINFFGIPVTGTLSFRARRGFVPLSKYGPSDGMVLLADMVFPGGITLIELGSDHFLFDRHQDITAVALATTVIRWLENSRNKSSPPVEDVQHESQDQTLSMHNHKRE